MPVQDQAVTMLLGNQSPGAEVHTLLTLFSMIMIIAIGPQHGT